MGSGPWSAASCNFAAAEQTRCDHTRSQEEEEEDSSSPHAEIIIAIVQCNITASHAAVRHWLQTRCIAQFQFVFLALLTTCHKECDQSANKNQCENATNNPSNESSVVVVIQH